MNNSETLFPTGIDASTARWDREWMQYFSTEDAHPHVVSYKRLRMSADIHGLGCREVFECSPIYEIDDTGDESKEAVPLHIWVNGSDLYEKKILEIGCGCGWLGKRLGLFCREYMGIDFSELAIMIARGSSPSNCHYHHIGEWGDILAHAGTLDLLVGREFFIHQNLDNARWVLRLGSALLRSGGAVSADFYLPDPKVPQGVVHPAAAGLDPDYPSCAFYYTENDIQKLANEVDLEVAETTEWLPYQRRFVLFRKP